jgi:cytoskeleton-associated protein 5
MQPLSSRGAALRPLGNGHRDSNELETENLNSLINDIGNENIERSVEALKAIQPMLEREPELFLNNIQTLVDVLLDELERAFLPPSNLHQGRYFRQVKHLIQTVSGITTSEDLMRRLNYDEIYSILSNLTLRLVQTDRLGGNPQELARYINMIVIQTLSTPDRLLVFKAMFSLFLNLSRDWSHTRPTQDSEVFAHADLVMKCLWKRCKILEDDFRNNRMEPGRLLGVLENFIKVVGPGGYRQRSVEGVALGDMPLRTVKSIIQRIVGE